MKILCSLWLTFNCCLFVGVFAFNIVLSNQTCTIEPRSVSWLGLWRPSHFYSLRNSWSFFCSFLAFTHLQNEARSYQHLHLNPSKGYSPIHFRIHYTFISSLVIKHKWLDSIESNIGPCQNIASTMTERWCGIIIIISSSFPLYCATG